MTLTWTTTPFADLPVPALYELLQLRSEVFVVEQTCTFQDMDGLDQQAYHLLGRTPSGELAAYARLFGPGITYPEASIGRVVVSPRHRRFGLGKALLTQALQQCAALFGPTQPIQIGAQQYLLNFYEEFGFRQRGAGYLEDGIPHVHMVRPGAAGH